MENAVVVSLFPLLGIIISVTLSFIISKYQIKMELIRIHSEYNRQLYSKRLEAYPEIFELVSGFIKIIERKEISIEKLLEFYEKYSKLDSKSSLLFSYTTLSSKQLMEKIGKILICKETHVFSAEDLVDLLEKLRKVETTMKFELGIYVYTNPTTITKNFDIPERKKKALYDIMQEYLKGNTKQIQ